MPCCLCYNTNEKTATGAVFSILLKGGIPMQREHWRKVLKLRTIAQTIAAIVSAIAAIHQLLKK